jgi:hypothetical protein
MNTYKPISTDSPPLSPHHIPAQGNGGDNEDVPLQLLKSGGNSPSQIKPLEQPVEGSQPEANNSEDPRSGTSENLCDEPNHLARGHEATETADQDLPNPSEDPVEAAATPESHGIYWKSCVLTILCFSFGVGGCIGHHAFYSHLDGVVVRSSDEQEWNIRSAYCLL